MASNIVAVVRGICVKQIDEERGTGPRVTWEINYTPLKVLTSARTPETDRAPSLSILSFYGADQK